MSVLQKHKRIVDYSGDGTTKGCQGVMVEKKTLQHRYTEEAAEPQKQRRMLQEEEIDSVMASASKQHHVEEDSYWYDLYKCTPMSIYYNGTPMSIY